MCPRHPSSSFYKAVHTMTDTTFNTTVPFPFSTNRSDGWAGIFFHQQRDSTAQSTCTSICCTSSFTRIPHTPSDEFAPLALPVESTEIRSASRRGRPRPSNIVHTLSSNPTARRPEQTTNTVISPSRFEIRSTSRPPARLPAAASPT